MIGFEEVAIGEGGGVRCARCHPRAATSAFHPFEEVAAQLAAAVARADRSPGPNVMLGGAEPFAHPELPRIVAAALAAGVVRLGIDTDAAAFASPANARGSISAGVRHVRATLLAGTPGLHDALVGAPGRLDATVQGLRAFLGAAEAEGVPVTVTVVVPVCHHNIEDVPAAVALASESGANRVTIRLDDGGLALSRTFRWASAGCDTGVVNGVWVEVEGMPFCRLPGYELHSADVMRARAGAKSAACTRCPLDAVCGGTVLGASADQLAELAPPEGAEALAAGVARARGEVA